MNASIQISQISDSHSMGQVNDKVGTLLISLLMPLLSVWVLLVCLGAQTLYGTALIFLRLAPATEVHPKALQS